MKTYHRRSLLFALGAAPLVHVLSPWGASAQDATPCAEMSRDDVETLVRRYWAEVWTAGGDAAVDELLAPDEIHHWGIGGDTTGTDAFTERLLMFLTAFPDISFTANLVAVQGDLAATQWTVTGTQQGEWQGIAPTNKQVAWDGINIFRVSCGRIAESWGEADHLSLLREIGAPNVPGTPVGMETAPLAAPAGTPCANDSPDANLALARRWTEEVWNKQALDVLDEIVDANAVHHGAAFPDVQGADAIKASLQHVFDAFPDIALTIGNTIADGDLVVVQWSGAGTHKGSFLGVDPTEKTVNFTGINVYRVHCGRIVESWSEFNGRDVLMQMTQG